MEKPQKSGEGASCAVDSPRYIDAITAADLFFYRSLPGLPQPRDLGARLELEQAIDVADLNEKMIEAERQQEQSSGHSKKTTGRKPRMRRATAEPLIADHLMCRPYDSAEEVAASVGCSVGVVGESKAWKLNQKRLRIAKNQGIDPKAVRLSEKAVNAAGGGKMRQLHDARQYAEDIDTAIDEREKDLFRRIGDYLEEHLGATPEETASAVGCTAGDVERRQAVLDGLTAERIHDGLEDVDVEDTSTQRGTRRKWVRKRV